MASNQQQECDTTNIINIKKTTTTTTTTTTSNNNKIDNNTNNKTNVVYTHKSNAKKIKTILEKEKYINKMYRMCPCNIDDNNNDSTISKDNHDISKKDGIIAIPILSDQINNIIKLIKDDSGNDNGEDKKEWIRYILGYGIYTCPYSTTKLGNHNNYHNSNDINTNENDNNELKFKSIPQEVVYQSCIDIIQQQQQQQQQQKQQSIFLETIIKEIKSLYNTMQIPKSFEILGNNDTLILPSCNTFEFTNNSESLSLSLSLPLLYELFTKQHEHENKIILYKNICKIYKVKRIIQNKRLIGTINSNSCIRESNYTIVYPYYTQDQLINLKGDKSAGWITIIENNIYQSYDITKVMFCRGNITEKIRIAKIISSSHHWKSKNKEIVLDMYAGIGYYTLPLLKYGSKCIMHLYACEWNKESIYALNHNISQNKIDDDKVTTYNIDCRTILQHNPTLKNNVNRIILGLLPSSQGSWKIAIQTLNYGWLHIHANIKIEEKIIWMVWCCSLLLSYINTFKNNQNQNGWIIIATHLEHVKSFAPKISHYVMDVHISPIDVFLINDNIDNILSIKQKDVFLKEFNKSEDNDAKENNNDSFFIVFDNDELLHNSCNYSDKVVDVPSCALDINDGIFSKQDWMK